MASEFKPGDIVRLKSGGPKMTIQSIGKFLPDEDIQAKRAWFEDRKIYVEVIGLAALVHAIPDGPRANKKRPSA